VPGPGQEAGELPGMGGVFNTVNLHVYHYAGNNPVKYVDPDGEEAKSFKQREGLYTFSCDVSKTEKTVVILSGLIPRIGFAMGTIIKGIYKFAGYKTIDGDKIKDAIMKYGGDASDAAGFIAKVSKIKGVGYLSFALTALSLILTWSEKDKMAMDNLIFEFLGEPLNSNSHEGVAFMYSRALIGMAELVKNGDVSYTQHIDGSIEINKRNMDAIFRLRDELRKIRSDKGLEPL
jgi:hypothetical protein